nr:protein N-terminal asparagine amidohydrolase [Ipomoea batatas]
MIYVGGVPFSTGSDDSSSSQGKDILMALMEHPALVSASSSFSAIQERKFSLSNDSHLVRTRQIKWVYIFQREYATVDPSLVDLVGTDEATTCVGLIIRNPQSGMISVAHMDSPSIVEVGLTQMLSSVLDQNSDTILDVHLIGGFNDVSHQHENGVTKSHEKIEGYSFPLCSKIVEILGKSINKFNIQTLHVLGHNTRQDSEGNAYPIFNGFLVETATGSIFPASFDGTTRCPDELIRRIRVTASFEDPSWSGRLLETYDTQSDKFIIAPCAWTNLQVHIALSYQNLSDPEILRMCSTSPFAEAPDFVDNQRRQWEYVLEHPDWRETFPSKQPRIFERTVDGSWVGHPVRPRGSTFVYAK